MQIIRYWNGDFDQRMHSSALRKRTRNDDKFTFGSVQHKMNGLTCGLFCITPQIMSLLLQAQRSMSTIFSYQQTNSAKRAHTSCFIVFTTTLFFRSCSCACIGFNWSVFFVTDYFVTEKKMILFLDLFVNISQYVDEFFGNFDRKIVQYYCKLRGLFNKCQIKIRRIDFTRDFIAWMMFTVQRESEKIVYRKWKRATKIVCAAFTTRANDWISLSNVAAVLACYKTLRDLYRWCVPCVDGDVYVCACVWVAFAIGYATVIAPVFV